YVTAMRRQRRWYFLIVGGIVAVAVVVVAVVMATGEISHVQLHPHTPAAPQIQPAQLNPAPKMAWQSSDATGIGEPVYQRTVVTHAPRVRRPRYTLTLCLTLRLHRDSGQDWKSCPLPDGPGGTPSSRPLEDRLGAHAKPPGS